MFRKGAKKKKPDNRRSYYELTFAGFIFGGIAAFVLIAAVNSQTNVLFWALGVVTGALILAAIVGNLLLKKLVIQRAVADHGVAGESLDVHYRLTNPKHWLPACAIRITEARFTGTLDLVPDGYCLHLGPRQSTLVMAHLIPARRGIIELREQRVCSSFPLGFITRALHVMQVQRIVVYPRIGFLSRQLLARSRTFSSTGSMTSLRSEGSDEFFSLREYIPGDPIRSIHWKRSARTGQLVVRNMTSDSPPTIVVVVDLRFWATTQNGLELSERAIELAAAWICRGLMDHFSVGLQVPGNPRPTPTMINSSRGQRQVLLESLARIDVAAIRPQTVSPCYEKQAKYAEYVIVNLRGEDARFDMVPPGCAYTLLSMDDPNAHEWVSYTPRKTQTPPEPAATESAAPVTKNTTVAAAP
jgi:uncharacterized protein (DUF58 family)